MTDVADFIIEHHGVKGQKWGIRNDRGHQGERAKTKKIAKLDKKFETNTNLVNAWVAVHNHAADLTNKNDVHRINNKPQYKDKDFSRDTPLRRKYYKEHQDAYLRNVEAAVKELGTNASGTKQYSIIETSNGDWQIHVTEVNHDDMTDVIIHVTYDDNGRILSVEAPKLITHSDIDGFIISHHGVKGQKWGIRHKPQRKKSSDFKTTEHLRKKRAHELSNKQLQKVNSRVNLEKNFKQLNPGTVQAGHDQVKLFLSLVSTAVAIHTLVNSPAGKAAISAGKNFITKLK